MWTLPTSSDAWRGDRASRRTEYTGLLQAIVEAEDDAERGLAELALIVFLLGENYSLSATDYQRLLVFAPETEKAKAWKLAVKLVAFPVLEVAPGWTEAPQQHRHRAGRCAQKAIQGPSAIVR